MICKRNDPVCPQTNEATEIVIWKPTGERFPVCEHCAEAIVKRSLRLGNKWERR